MKKSPVGERGPTNPDEREWSSGYLVLRDTPDLRRVDSTFELYALA